jgi:hypothetical protein
MNYHEFPQHVIAGRGKPKDTADGEEGNGGRQTVHQ